jgi:hypothetical protein
MRRLRKLPIFLLSFAGFAFAQTEKTTAGFINCRMWNELNDDTRVGYLHGYLDKDREYRSVHPYESNKWRKYRMG